MPRRHWILLLLFCAVLLFCPCIFAKRRKKRRKRSSYDAASRSCKSALSKSRLLRRRRSKTSSAIAVLESVVSFDNSSGKLLPSQTQPCIDAMYELGSMKASVDSIHEGMTIFSAL